MFLWENCSIFIYLYTTQFLKLYVLYNYSFIYLKNVDINSTKTAAQGCIVIKAIPQKQLPMPAKPLSVPPLPCAYGLVRSLQVFGSQTIQKFYRSKLIIYNPMCVRCNKPEFKNTISLFHGTCRQESDLLTVKANWCQIRVNGL